MNHTLLRNAKVEVSQMFDENGHTIADIIIDDQYHHEFEPTSRVSRSLEIMTPEDLSNQMSGGHFFMIEDDLYDFRTGNYNGFVHTDNSISHLADIIGINEVTPNGIRVHENTTSRDITLGAQWSNHDIQIPQYNAGGDFSSELHFGWSPFIKTVNSAFMLTRLICTNGMRGMRTFMNTKIPLMNRWEEHLEIANRQIQNKVNSMVIQRMTQMGSERATIAETTLLAQHARARLDGYITNQATKDRLNNIISIVSPRRHLEGVYKDNVFTDHNIAAQHPAHLSTFDVYNIATEIRSHTDPVEKSTSRAMDKLSNDLVFERADLTQHISQLSQPKVCNFSNPEAAFFGDLH